MRVLTKVFRGPRLFDVEVWAKPAKELNDQDFHIFSRGSRRYFVTGHTELIEQSRAEHH